LNTLTVALAEWEELCLQYCYISQWRYSSSSQPPGTLQCHAHVQCHTCPRCIMVHIHSHSGDRSCLSDPSTWASCRAIQLWTCVWEQRCATSIHTWQYLFPLNIRGYHCWKITAAF